MNENNLIKIFLISLAVLIVALVAINSSTKKAEDYAYDNAPKIAYNQVLDDTEGLNVYYYYQYDCAHCIELKPEINDFFKLTESNDNIDFYLIDAADQSLNKDVWASQDENYVLDTSTTDPEAIKITGTPSMMYTKDGAIQSMAIGNDQVEKLMETVKTDSEYYTN